MIMTTATPAAVNQGTVIPHNPNAQYLRINEVVSSNKNGIADYQGDHGDWIELYNTSSTSVNLKNLVLQAGSATYQFANNDNIALAPNGYLVIFCDGKDTVVNKGGGLYEVHTSFNISSSGETITLYNTDRSVIDTITMPGVPRDCGRVEEDCHGPAWGRRADFDSGRDGGGDSVRSAA
jgi:secreted PhoX family phosphatase